MKVALGQWNNVYNLANLVHLKNDKVEVWQPYAGGTAFVIGKTLKKTYFCTNNHVALPPFEPLSGETVLETISAVNINQGNPDSFDELTLEGRCEEADVAILSLENRLNCEVPKRCKPERGETVYVIGYPYGESRVVESGIVSSDEFSSVRRRFGKTGVS